MESIGLGTIAALVLFPMLIALILLFVRNDRARSYITVIGALVIACASIFLAAEFLPAGPQQFAVNAGAAHIIGYVTLAIDVLLCIYVIAKGVYYKKYLACFSRWCSCASRCSSTCS